MRVAKIRLLRNKKALSNVVSTLILLVVSVLLAGVVTLYATNVTMTRTQQEEIRIRKQHIWVYENGTAIAGFVIDNVGGKDIVIDKIHIRGVESDWTNVYYYRRSSSVSADLKLPNASLSGSSVAINYAGTEGATFTQGTANQDITMASGATLVVYVKNPDNISPNDIGTAVGITIFTVNGQWYVECNVETAET
jgi:hypothetical protein